MVLDDERRPVLASCVLPCVWHERRMVAHHLRDDGTEVEAHAAPRRRCECGIYAVHDTASRWLDRLGGPDTIVGAVRMSGTVRRHREEGVRAEVAEIVALARPPGPLWAHPRFPLHRHRLSVGERSLPTEEVDPMELATRYRVPLVDPRHLTMVALEHGATLWP